MCTIISVFVLFIFIQVFVSRSETTTVLTGLKPETEYVVNVFSIVEGTSSEPLKGTETTCK